jgi:hypothetical protein
MSEKEPNEQKPTIQALCAAWLLAKNQEEQAKNARVATELLIISELGFNKPEGSKTFNPEGFKVECKAGITYKLDLEKWKEIQGQIPDGLRPIKFKIEADEKGIKYHKDKEPEIYKIAAQAITAAPQKIGVKVEAQAAQEAA